MLDFFVNPYTVADRNNFTGSTGKGFTPARNLIVRQLGRFYANSNTQNHTIRIWQHATPGAPIVAATVLASSPSDANGYKWVDITPVTLSAGVTYYILSEETNGGDLWPDLYEHTGLLQSGDVTMTGNAYATTPSAYIDGFSAGTQGFNTPTFKYDKDTSGFKTYYVSAAGIDSNNGLTTGTPFLTFAKAVSVAAYYDVINLRAPDVFTISPTTFTIGVTIQSYGTGRATLQVTGSTQDAIIFSNTSDGQVRNVKILGANTGTPVAGSGTFKASRPAGVLYRNTNTGTIFYNNCVVTGNDISGFQTLVEFESTDTSYAGVAPWGSGWGSGYDRAEVTNNDLHVAYDCGVKTSNGTQNSALLFLRTHVADNRIWDIHGNTSWNSGFGVFYNQALGDYAGTANATGTVERNTVWHVGYNANHAEAAGPAGILTCYSRGITMQLNEVYDVRANAILNDGIGIDIDLVSRDCVIQDNYCHDNDAAAVYVFFADYGTSVVRRNICKNNCRVRHADFGEITVNNNGGAQVYDNYVEGNWKGIVITGVRTTDYCSVTNNVVRTTAGNTLLELRDNANLLGLSGNDFSDGTTTPTFKWLGTTYHSLREIQKLAAQDVGTIGERDLDGLSIGPNLIQLAALDTQLDEVLAAFPPNFELLGINNVGVIGGVTEVGHVIQVDNVGPGAIVGGSFAASALAEIAIAGSGDGAREVTVTVTTSGATPIQNAIVRMAAGASAFTATTDSSGVASFSLDDAVYTRSITAAGYSFTPDSKTVDATHTAFTATMTLNTITTPALPSQTTAYLTTYDYTGAVKGGVVIYFRMVTPPGVAGQSFDGTTRSATSNASTGLLQATLLQSTAYEAWRGANGAKVPFTTGTASTYQLPEVLGLDQD